MKIYLYLEKKEYVNTWINGGKVPLKLASTYLSEERRGIYTPDEVLQQSLTNAPLNAIQAIAELSGNAEMIIDGPTLIINNEVYQNVQYSRFHEDSLILCMSTKLDKSIAEKMNKKGCVEITNFDKLQKELSKQIGTLGISNKCEYTTSDNRNHFLKSSFDNWQEEYRIIWKGVNNSLDVIIPKGIAEDVSNLMS